jgi:hypothetical protein
MPIGTSTHTYTHMHTRIYTHMHTRIHTQTHTNEGNVREQAPTPSSPSQRNLSYQSPPQALRLSTRRTNPNPHSPHQQTSLLPRVLSPPNRSTAPLLSLSHSFTNLRFSLAPMHSRAHPRSLSHYFTN